MAIRQQRQQHEVPLKEFSGRLERVTFFSLFCSHAAAVGRLVFVSALATRTKESQ